MSEITVSIGGELFDARFRDELAPLTCARFRSLLPYRNNLIHAKWSGEACWIPLGTSDYALPPESVTGDPKPGEMIFYSGSIGETEILLAYGRVRFACAEGALVGTPFLAITDDLRRLAQIGREILWGGSRDLVITMEK